MKFPASTLRDLIRNHGSAALVLAFLLAVNAAVLAQIAFVDFWHLDWGGFLDAAWRIYQGQKPYVDFYYHSGPVHLYLHVFFFLIFGFGKTAILAHLITVNTAVILATFFAVYRRIPLFFATLCAVATMIGYYWLYRHPYYDYTAHLWGIMGIAVLMRQLPLARPRRGLVTGIFCGVMTALILLTKLNIGAAYGLAFALTLAISRVWRQTLSGFFLGTAGMLALLVLTLPSPVAFIENIRDYTVMVEGRLIRFLLLPAYVKNFFWLPLILVYLISGQKKWEAPGLFILLAGVYGVSIFAINTGSYRGWDYVPTLGILLALGFLFFFDLLARAPKPVHRRLIIGGIVVLTLQAGIQSAFAARATLNRVQDYHRAEYKLQAGAFRGWHISSAAEGETFDAIVRYLTEEIPQEDSLLILSDLVVFYSLSGRQSFPGVSFHWYPGSVPAPGSQREKTRAAILDHLPDWILTSADHSGKHPINANFAYLKIPIGFILDRYEIHQTWGNHALLKRRAT